MSKIIKSSFLLFISIIIFNLLLEIIFFHLYKYYSLNNNTSFSIGVYYGKMFFSILIILSTSTWFLKNRNLRYILIILMFLIYLYYWITSIKIHPYRISLILIISLFVYFFMHYLMKKLVDYICVEVV